MAVAEADATTHAVPRAVLEGDDLVALVVAHDLGRDLGALDVRGADGDVVVGDEDEILDGCGVCDFCLGSGAAELEVDPEERSLIIRKALSGVARLDGRLGLRAAAMLVATRNWQMSVPKYDPAARAPSDGPLPALEAAPGTKEQLEALGYATDDEGAAP